VLRGAAGCERDPAQKHGCGHPARPLHAYCRRRALAAPYGQETRANCCGSTTFPSPNAIRATIVVEMTPAESALYSAVEDFIGDVYRAAPSEKRSAVGFVLTVYRRRLASSFRSAETNPEWAADADWNHREDASQDETSDEVMSAEEVANLAAEAPEAIDERERSTICSGESRSWAPIARRAGSRSSWKACLAMGSIHDRVHAIHRYHGVPAGLPG